MQQYATQWSCWNIFEIKTQEHIWTHVWCPRNWHVWKNGLNFNYVWQPASEEKPAEDFQTAPHAEVAPVSWFGNGPTHADLGCDDSFCRVRGGDIPLVEFFPLFLLGFVVGETRASSSGWHFRDFFELHIICHEMQMNATICNTMIVLKILQLRHRNTSEHMYDVHGIDMSEKTGWTSTTFGSPLLRRSLQKVFRQRLKLK